MRIVDLFPLLMALLAWADLSVVRMLRHRHAGPVWWTILTLAWLVGAMLGVLGGFFFEYQPSPRLRVFGAPVPAAFFHWEGPPGGDQWVDYITPTPIVFAGSNVVILALLAA
jgi:hypothetical protein